MKTFKFITLLAIIALLSSCDSSKDKTAKDLDNTNKNAVVKGKPEYLTYETFKEKVWNFEENPQNWVYKGTEPCIIDFYADWCKPCRMIAPIMEEIAAKYEGRLKVYKIDTQTERELARVFRIQSIPTILFAPLDGTPMIQSGAFPKETYIKIIEGSLLMQPDTAGISSN